MWARQDAELAIERPRGDEACFTRPDPALGRDEIDVQWHDNPPVITCRTAGLRWPRTSAMPPAMKNACSGKVVVVAIAELAERLDRLSDRYERTLLPGERLGNEHVLRQEPLDASRAPHENHVFFAEFVDRRGSR